MNNNNNNQNFKSFKSLENLSNILSSNNSIKNEAKEKLNTNVIFEILHKKNNEKMIWLLKANKADEVSLAQINEDDGLINDNDIVIKIDDLNLKKLINGKQSAQKLFIMGKLKIKGNVMKAGYIEKLLKYTTKEKAKL